MSKVKGLSLFELVVPHDQLRLWEGFINADMEATLVGLPSRILRDRFNGQNVDVII